MSFDARVFRILIASPSDVTDAREIAVRTIQGWNDLNSAERQIVLLPLRWETHSAPEYGLRPQEAINRQVVDHCDLLVGIFWTRIGSPTGAAESGTLEEIERVATQGKRVMLYFSRVERNPDEIEIDQLQKLREFKKKTFPKALVESYATKDEFRDKFARQIEIQLRTLVTEESVSSIGDLKAKPITDIQFGFAEPETGAYLGSECALAGTLIDVTELDRVPNHNDPPGIVVMGRNRSYYRELVSYKANWSFVRPLRFWLKNVGSVGARNVHVDLKITALQGELSVYSSLDFRLQPPREFYSFQSINAPIMASPPTVVPRRPDDIGMPAVERCGNYWSTYIELLALQPKREVTPPPWFVIGANDSGPITIDARIYADTLPEPLARALRINWKVERSVVKANDLLKDVIGPSGGPGEELPAT